MFPLDYCPALISWLTETRRRRIGTSIALGTLGFSIEQAVKLADYVSRGNEAAATPFNLHALPSSESAGLGYEILEFRCTKQDKKVRKSQD